MPFIDYMLTVCNSARKLTEKKNSINSQHCQRTLCLSFAENRFESGVGMGLPYRYGVLEAESDVPTAASLQGTRPLFYNIETIISLYCESLSLPKTPHVL